MASNVLHLWTKISGLLSYYRECFPVFLGPKFCGDIIIEYKSNILWSIITMSQLEADWELN